MNVLESLKKKICLRDLAKKFVGHDIFKKKSFWRVAVLLIFVFFCLYNFPYIYGKKTDDSSFYIASRGILSRTNIYDENEFYSLGDELFGKSVEFWPYLYSPVLAELLVPLASKNYETFTVVWFILNLILGFACPVLTFYAVRRNKNVNYLLDIFLLCLCVMSFIFRYILKLGQVNFFVYLLIILSILFYRNKKSFLSSLMLAMAALIKSFPFIYLLYFLIIKDFKYIKQFILSSFAIIFSSILIFGPEIWVKYLSFLTHNFISTEKTPFYLHYLGYQNNFSLHTILVQFFEFTNLPIHKTDIIYLITVISICFISVYVLFRGRRNMLHSFSLLSVTYLLISPICWRHHYILITLILFYVIFSNAKNKLTISIAALLATSVMFYYPSWRGFPFNSVILISAVTIYFLLLFIKDKAIHPIDNSPLQERI